MHVRAATAASILMLAAILGLIAGCSSGASFADRMAYLEKVANEGVQTHRLIASQGGVTTTKRCTDAYSGLQDQNPPSDQDDDVASQGWLNQIQAFFVESCVTGLPKAIPGQSTGSPSGSPSSSPSGSPSSSVSPSASPSTTPTR